MGLLDLGKVVGDTGPRGPIGETGPAGADGRTPEKGVDYWTPTDKAEIVDEVVTQVGTGGGVTMELLWENASPASAFLAQTLTLDLQECEFVAIEILENAKYYPTGNSQIGLIRKGMNGTVQIQVNARQQRRFYVSDTGIEVAGGLYADVGKSASGDNASAIPTVIYGFKGVP